MYRLYEKSPEIQKEYISDWLNWAIHEYCEDPKWSPLTVDKISTANLLTNEGIPTIKNLAVIDGSNKQYETETVIRSANELVDFLEVCPMPIFCKPLDLLASIGIFKIESFSENIIQLGNGDRLTANDLIQKTMGELPYILQPVVQNHASIREFATGLATVRAMNFNSDDVDLSHSILKIPVGSSLADNAWRQGNLVAEIDKETGTILRVVEASGIKQKLHEAHPLTGHKLVGMQIPYWSELLDLNQKTAKLFSAIKYLTLDLAITDAGPIVVEVNSGGSFTLPQIATGRGFLNEKTKTFFESCGVNFEKLPSPTRIVLTSFMQKLNPFS